MHGDPEALARLAQDVLLRYSDVVEPERPKIVPSQAHRVVPSAHLEPLHAPLEDQGHVSLVAVRERDQDVLRAVADEPLLAVQPVGAVGLTFRPAPHVVCVRSGFGLGEGEPGQLPARRQVRQEPFPLPLRPEQMDRLHPDGLVHAHHDGKRPVELGELLHHPAVARLGEALPAVLGRDVQAQQSLFAERPDDLVPDPTLLLHPPGVIAGQGVVDPPKEARHLLLLLAVHSGEREGHLLGDVAAEQGLRQGRSG